MVSYCLRFNLYARLILLNPARRFNVVSNPPNQDSGGKTRNMDGPNRGEKRLF